jgi:hypothetical protein
VARAGIEPATFRFSGGYACDSKPFALVRALQLGRIGPLRAPVLKVWPDIGRMDSCLAGPADVRTSHRQCHIYTCRSFVMP